MSRAMPTKVTIKFDDDSQAEAYFDRLPMPLQAEIMRQPFASKASEEPQKQNYVLLEWDDGWKEVVEVDNTCTDINRYYVISRPEDIGRLSLNRKDGYPEMIEILRKPLQLSRITFGDSLDLGLEESKREGNKVDHFFSLTKKGDGFLAVVATCQQVLSEEAIDLQRIAKLASDSRKELYETIARKMGIRAASRQQDLFDFIAYLLMAAR